MLKDISAMNPKGHVKLELYNDEEGVFFTKEKKNLVVQSANKIVAEMMADPSKVIRINQLDKGDTAFSPNSDSLYPFNLTVQHELKAKYKNDWGELNSKKEFEIEDLKNITTLDRVTVGETELALDKDIFLMDASKGKIKFADAPTEEVTISYHKIINPYMKIVAGTETVKIDNEIWSRSDVAKNENKTYRVDFRTGEVLFETVQKNVEISYDYHMKYALGFMALGGKPNVSHPNYQPVEFGNSNKLDVDMKNEFPDSRMAIQYPASISTGATELEPAIPTQPVSTVLKTADIDVTDTGDSVTKLLKYELPNIHDTGSGNAGRKLYEIVSVQNKTTSTDIDKSNTSITSNTLNKIEIQLNDDDVSIGDKVHIVYRLKLDDSHLIYQLGQSPVVELVSVKHVDAGTGEVKPYTIIDGGLRANEGEVWISNPSTGHITFSSNPTSGAPKVETPGQLTIEYKVNAGTVVKFIADFPKGVPAPTLVDTTKSSTVLAGQSAIILDYAIAKDEKGAFIEPEITLTSNGATSTLTPAQYSISVDGKSISISGLNAGDTVIIKHKYEKSTHDIYQVAMFDDKVGGKMFNISGIGPVTKDKNTGMRITWMVTF
ncbi:hypothetical protein B14_200222 (plasmid) [Bacillus licheniformis]|uniref:hypothetical protein n=1 Tax=Bacillus licheniformis TaxID=1402 RepID=UPI0009B779AD|nr:hypothetical protein [Bacillus licheniformis]ARC67433.1 hypothetical protein B14_200222 [Bacillus licheniformis]ARW46158.1 hypothetical protein S100141_04940 [Bacillus licheniformis]MDE1421863.1 hypothetical protein [Bacillus licheniformis]MEC0475868.1 hypothetical protein [Bacillus licheniformis]TWK10784.1 hypothetical protein CHCC20442_4099 [Bacillus licheniformis]